MEDSMIVREFFATRRDGVDLYHTYSDAGYVIRQEQTGEEYEDAIDVINAPYTYTETDKRVQDIVGIEDYTELRG